LAAHRFASLFIQDLYALTAGTVAQLSLEARASISNQNQRLSESR